MACPRDVIQFELRSSSGSQDESPLAPPATGVISVQSTPLGRDCTRALDFPKPFHGKVRHDAERDGAVALSANLTETPAPLGITVGRWR